MLPIKIIEKIFSASNIQRWNDHIKAVELTEIDKQSHKAIIAYIIAKNEENKGKKINYNKLIEGMLFEILQRIELTDLRPNVYHKIMKEKGLELNKWVFKNLENMFEANNEEIKEKFKEYLFNSEYSKYEKKILSAAHYLATHWEFKHIYQLNSFLYGIDDTKKEIELEIEKHYELEGVQKLILDKKIDGFVSICGQLRFQQRWAQSPRIPKTTVLGHMFFVAILSLFCSHLNKSCEKKFYNNFFTSLFHDLPEVLTRDIISPIKTSVDGLDLIIKECEEYEMEKKIYPLLPEYIKKEMIFFTKDEFKNKIILENKLISDISEQDILIKYNKDIYNPCDGKMLKICDNLSAFIEASMSIKYGIKSDNILNAKERLFEKYKNSNNFNINFSEIFEYFYNLN